MTENEFDEFFRRKLHDYQSAVPEDSWAKIQRRSDEDRRRPFIWWTLAAVLFIGVATGGYFMLHHQNTTANGQLADQLPSKNNNKNTQTNADDIKSTQKDSSGISENNNGNKTSGNVSSAHEELNNIKKIEVGKSQGHQANKNSVTNDEIAKQKPVKKNVPGNDARLQNQPESKVDKPIVGNNDANLNSAGHTDNNIVQEKQNAGNADSSASTLANANKASLSKQKKSPENTNASAKTKKKEQNSSSKDRYIEIFASPAYGWSNANAKAGYEDYLTEKKGSEKSSVSFNTGFRLMQKLNDHFFVKAGLQFTQVNQKFTYNTPNVYRDVPVAVQRNITTDAGAVNSYVSFSMARMIGYTVITETNHYNSLELPLLVGYETSGNKFKASVSTGVVFNLHSWYKGYVVDTFYQAADIKEFAPYKNNMGVSLYLGVGLQQVISDRTALFAEPYIQYRLGKMTNSSAPFTQKMNVGGLSLGLRYKF